MRWRDHKLLAVSKDQIHGIVLALGICFHGSDNVRPPCKWFLHDNDLHLELLKLVRIHGYRSLPDFHMRLLHRSKGWNLKTLASEAYARMASIHPQVHPGMRFLRSFEAGRAMLISNGMFVLPTNPLELLRIHPWMV